MRARRGLGALAVVVCGSAVLTACGAKAYVPLTSANFATALAAASANLHTAHEVSTGNGVTTTIDFDSSGLFKYRMTQTRAGGATTSPAETLIGVGPDRYLQDPGVTPSGKWLRLPVTGSSAPVKFADIDPVGMVVRFNKGMKQFAYLGKAAIAGVQVEHYRVSIDQQKFLKATGQGLGSANLGNSETLTEDVYVNDDNTLRRVSLTLPGGVGNTRIDVTDWGKPIAIHPPPASAVVTSVAPTKPHK